MCIHIPQTINCNCTHLILFFVLYILTKLAMATQKPLIPPGPGVPPMNADTHELVEKGATKTGQTTQPIVGGSYKDDSGGVASGSIDDIKLPKRGDTEPPIDAAGDGSDDEEPPIEESEKKERRKWMLICCYCWQRESCIVYRRCRHLASCLTCRDWLLAAALPQSWATTGPLDPLP